MASANQLERPDGGGNPEWLQAGADDALGKPFGRADVERLLKKYCISSKGKENDFL